MFQFWEKYCITPIFFRNATVYVEIAGMDVQDCSQCRGQTDDLPVNYWSTRLLLGPQNNTDSCHCGWFPIRGQGCGCRTQRNQARAEVDSLSLSADQSSQYRRCHASFRGRIILFLLLLLLLLLLDFYFQIYLVYCFTCINVLPVYMWVYRVHAWCPQRSENGVGSPGTKVTDSCEVPYGCWELTHVLCKSDKCP